MQAEQEEKHHARGDQVGRFAGHQWQDIATAPKDGRMILVYPSSTWTDDTELDYEVTYWDDQASYVGGTFVGAWHQFRHPDDYTGPTHWRPLPSPPVPSES